MSVQQKIIALFEAASVYGAGLKTQEIAAMLGIGRDAAKHQVEDLFTRGRIERIDIGVYRLAGTKSRQETLAPVAPSEPFIKAPTMARLMGGRA